MKHSWIAVIVLGYSLVLTAGSGRKVDSTSRNAYVEDVENRVAKIEVALPAMKSNRDAAVNDPSKRKYLSDRVDDLQDRIDDLRVEIREVRGDANEPTPDTKQKINKKLAELESLYQTKAD